MKIRPQSKTEAAMFERAISEWRQWQVQLRAKPEWLATLGQGLSNRSFLLQSGDDRLVLRLNSADSRLPGVDRQREAIIWRAAYKAGLAPALLHAEQRYLVSRFVPDETFNPDQNGKDWTRKDLTVDDLSEEVFRLMDLCHEIKIETHQIEYADHIQTYWTVIEGAAVDCADIDAELKRQRQPMQDTLNTLIAQNQEWVLCHHDPVMANFVGTPERLFLIDWEYAAKGMAVMDYAALAVEWGFSDALICSRTQIRLDSLVMAKKLYRYMCRLWEASQKQPNHAD